MKTCSFRFANYFHSCFRFCAGVFLALAWLGLSAAQAQTTTYVLGTSAILVGSDAETDSVVLGVTPATGAWTATTNATWLHLSAANQSGRGSTNVFFSDDANPGAARVGTLTIGGQTLTVTQAGSTYIAASEAGGIGPNTAPPPEGPFYTPEGPAVDGAGNVFYADTINQAIREWTAANHIVTTLVSSGLSSPSGVAVDSSGNVFIADKGNNAIKEWLAGNSNVITLVSSGLTNPCGVAVDGAGNVYIADTGNDAIKERPAAISNVITLVSIGLSSPHGVAVDAAGNVYIADAGNGAIKEWMAANSNVITLVSSGLSGPQGVAVDGAGHVYIADSEQGGELFSTDEWTPANSNLTVMLWLYFLAGGPADPFGIAVAGADNVYISFVGPAGDGDIMELSYNLFADLTPRSESEVAGTVAWPVLLPVTANYDAGSDQPWLTINGITNGVLSVSFTANTSGASRTANISLVNQVIPFTQSSLSYSLGTDLLFEGPTAGTDTVSVVLTVSPPIGPWTATANASWLHLSSANQSGTGSTNLDFSFDADPGPARSGTLTIAGQTLTVLQSSAAYYLGTYALMEENTAGSDSVVLTASSQ